MRKFFAAVLISLPTVFYAQESVIQEGEFGFGLGAAHYFGDLNNRTNLSAPKLAAHLFFRKNFGNYIAVRIGGTFAQLGYSDVYNKHNEYMNRRNLSFNTNLWEIALQGDFNFYRFMPGDPDFNFTPYITMGASLFNYDPYAYIGEEKHYLRPLGTEGQGNPGEAPVYSTMAMAIPFGVGLKYSINDRINVGVEVVHRFTNTDYLDDVSSTYADPAYFPPLTNGDPSPAFILQNRATSPPYGTKGFMRGNSQNKDQFTTAIFYISLNLQSYKCPSVN